MKAEEASEIARRVNHFVPSISEARLASIRAAAEAGKNELSVDGLPEEEEVWLLNNGYLLTSLPAHFYGHRHRIVKIEWAK